ncbi:DUF5718 family protein [Rubritalea marina]|uniref:DUF5718 family protein n=1 Tax=Rubritalea marina TaxID=361055 RepID=UPI0003A4AA5F|nr:DUF5718 family protein [Rubritalea marina]
MHVTTLSKLTNNEAWIGLGIAGNQAEHLDQAGEANDFKEVVAPENAPKGMFPWFLPDHGSFLSKNPLSSSLLNDNEEGFLQPEPEIGLVLELEYADGSEELLSGVQVLGFSAFNDCSRRIAAPKISIKKNWGGRLPRHGGGDCTNRRLQ